MFLKTTLPWAVGAQRRAFFNRVVFGPPERTEGPVGNG